MSMGFEPMALFVTLGEILHECQVIWDLNSTDLAFGDMEKRAVEMGSKRLAVKGLALDCVSKLVSVLQETEGVLEAGMNIIF